MKTLALAFVVGFTTAVVFAADAAPAIDVTPPKAAVCLPGKPCAALSEITLTLPSAPVATGDLVQIAVSGIPAAALPTARIAVAPSDGTTLVVGQPLQADGSAFAVFQAKAAGTYTFFAAASGSGGLLFSSATLAVAGNGPSPAPVPVPVPTPVPVPVPTKLPILTLITAKPTWACPECARVDSETVPALESATNVTFKRLEHSDAEAQKLYPLGLVPRWLLLRVDGSVEKRIGYQSLQEIQTWVNAK